MFQEDLKIWFGSLKRGLAVAGFTFFSLAITTGFCLDSFFSSLISGGLYMFVEIVKKYGIDVSPISQPQKERAKKNFKFLIFP